MIEQDAGIARGWPQSTDAGLSCAGSGINTSSIRADANMFAGIRKLEDPLPTLDRLTILSECLLHLPSGLTPSKRSGVKTGD